MSQIGDIEIVKPAIFHRQALETIRSFPAGVQGIGEGDFRFTKRRNAENATSGAGDRGGVEEIRIRDGGGSYQAFGSIGARHFDFHAFTKKTQETAKRELILGRKRLKELMNE